MWYLWGPAGFASGARHNRCWGRPHPVGQGRHPPPPPPYHLHLHWFLKSSSSPISQWWCRWWARSRGLGTSLCSTPTVSPTFPVLPSSQSIPVIIYILLPASLLPPQVRGCHPTWGRAWPSPWQPWEVLQWIPKQKHHLQSHNTQVGHQRVQDLGALEQPAFDGRGLHSLPRAGPDQPVQDPPYLPLSPPPHPRRALPDWGALPEWEMQKY